MLREAKNVGFTRRLTLIGFRYQLVQGRKPLTKTWGSSKHRALVADQAESPIPVATLERRTYWVFDGRFWWDDDGLEPNDVLALIRQRERRKERQLKNAHAGLALDEDPRPRREPILRDVRQAVWERDGGACVECGATFDIQYDHIIPVSRGGATSVGNLQILCGECNRAKTDSIA